MSDNTIALGGGCFWCIDSAFRLVKGVVAVMSGYAAGNTENPSYEDICTGTTNHAEVVKLDYNEDIVSTKELLVLFFSLHDPTTLNRQGADKGTQYRSIILYNDEEQKRIATEMIHQLDASDTWSNPIVTELAKLTRFYPAESYHQDYYRKNPNQGYCQMVVKPKLEKFQSKHIDFITEG